MTEENPRIQKWLEKFNCFLEDDTRQLQVLRRESTLKARRKRAEVGAKWVKFEPQSIRMEIVKGLGERWNRVWAVYVDKTKHGDYIQDMEEAGVPIPEGVTFTQATKQEMAQLLKQRMVEGAFQMPFDRVTLDELNTEKYELTKTGKITFSHPEGTHDDRFWALAVYAAEKAPPPLCKPMACVI